MGIYGMAASSAAGTVAGSGDAIACSGATPMIESIGVAIDDPPTPKTPVSTPIEAPASTNSGQEATGERKRGGRARDRVRRSSASPAGPRRGDAFGERSLIP